MARTDATDASRGEFRSPFIVRRLATLLCAFVVLVSLVEAAAPMAQAVTPKLILGRPRVGEFQPVRGEAFLAWQQNTRSRPRHYDVFARPLDGGGGKFMVNASGTNGANGEIDGQMLVYQQFNSAQKTSDLKFFDLANGNRTSPPSGVNTKRWEYWPSMSGQWLLFARLYGGDLRRLFLFDLSTGDSRRLDEVRGSDAFLAPGEVSGDYAVWSKCPSTSVCDVFRYHISAGTKRKIPNDGYRQHAPSVTPEGTVYFARSNAECGDGVKLMRRPIEGTTTVLWRLPSGDDVGSTKTFVDSDGITTLTYDHFACGQPAESDSWEIVEDFAPQLSVTLEGDAIGTVTSSPAGINCGSDCTESYESGTGVTLTASPQTGASFAGWSGACTGTSPTCALTMDGPKSVTATFTKKPVLTVTKSGSGQGTVTSSPAGIDCGTDCNQPYDRGSNVTLTADPNQSSTFGGWNGACTGMSLTCTVTMNGDRSVTATFTIKPLLRVLKSGNGNGLITSNPAGIDCGSDCDQFYNTGTNVTLSVDPNADSTFAGWSGACSGMTCTVTMNADRTVTATFTKKQHDLQVSTSGTGTGTVARNPAGTSCGAGCFRYDFGTPVDLTAQPAANSTFGSWSGDCSGTSPTCSVTMDTDKAVTATFALKPQLTLTKSGDGQGIVTSNPAGINCGTACAGESARFDPGASVTVTADPEPDTTLVTWSGDCDTVVGNDCTVTMNGDKVVTADFDDPLILAPSSGATWFRVLLAKGLIR